MESAVTGPGWSSLRGTGRIRSWARSAATRSPVSFALPRKPIFAVPLIESPSKTTSNVTFMDIGLVISVTQFRVLPFALPAMSISPIGLSSAAGEAFALSDDVQDS